MTFSGLGTPLDIKNLACASTYTHTVDGVAIFTQAFSWQKKGDPFSLRERTTEKEIEKGNRKKYSRKSLWDEKKKEDKEEDFFHLKLPVQPLFCANVGTGEKEEDRNRGWRHVLSLLPSGSRKRHCAALTLCYATICTWREQGPCIIPWRVREFFSKK